MGAPKKVVVQKKHYCPSCNGVCQPTMRMPRRRMVFICAEGHTNQKKDCILL